MAHSGSSSLTPSASIRLAELGQDASLHPAGSSRSAWSSSSTSRSSSSGSSSSFRRPLPDALAGAALDDDDDGPFFYGPTASSSAIGQSGMATSSGGGSNSNSIKGKARELDAPPVDDDEEDDEGPFVDPENGGAGSGSSSASSSGGESGRRRLSPTFRRQQQTAPSRDATHMPSGSPSTTHFRSPSAAADVDVDESEAGFLLPPPTVAAQSGAGEGGSSSAGGTDRHHRRKSHKRREGDSSRYGSSSRRSTRGPTSLRDRAAAVTSWGWGRRADGSRRRLAGKERALWEWVNVDDLDEFLGQVYDFYLGKGLFCILLARGLNLVTVGFVIFFSSFLLRCVDYGALAAHSGLGEQWPLRKVLVPQCASSASFGAWFLSLLFLSFYAYQLASFIRSIPRLLALHRFFDHLLEMPDEDIQTTNWNDVVRAIEGIREANSATSVRAGAVRLDAHDIANRLMRQENYLVALLSPGPATETPASAAAAPPRPRLDLSLDRILPAWLPASLRERQWLTRVVVWNLRFCLLGFLFDGRAGGEVRRGVLRSKGNRPVLAETLRRRLRFMALVNVVLGPAIAVYLVVYSFFRYFEEYHKNPSSIGGRAYTPQARWLFREYNELPHLFERRLAGSLPIARKYVDQFPKERTAIVMRFVSFIAGSFAAVLLLLTILDPSTLLALEITPHRTVLFYLTLCGGILAVTRTGGEGGSESRKAYDPEVLMRGVEYFTHWMPSDWEGRLHSTYVLDDFSRLFTLKLVVFLSEIASVFLTPLLLWSTLPSQAEPIVDFFREFTIQVEGVGYVCSLAVFDFGRVGKGKGRADEASTTADRRRPDSHAAKLDRMREREPAGGKMERSFLNFKANNPSWTVQDPTSSIFLSRLQEQQASSYGRPPHRPTQDPSPREGAMQASFYLAEHNVPSFGGLRPGGVGGSPLNGQPSPGLIARSGGVGGGSGKHPSIARSIARSRQAPVLQEENTEDEREAGGWDDVAGDERALSNRRGGGLDNDDDVDDGEDQDLLRLLSAIGSTRLGR